MASHIPSLITRASRRTRRSGCFARLRTYRRFARADRPASALRFGGATISTSNRPRHASLHIARPFSAPKSASIGVSEWFVSSSLWTGKCRSRIFLNPSAPSLTLQLRLFASIVRRYEGPKFKYFYTNAEDDFVIRSFFLRVVPIMLFGFDFQFATY